ncbi:hypothetical protein Bamb_5279 [Burkholderia ambifaria AMMD]|uniref:Uncharacterized protein n=1 Tax=Burkholderia ambifaria (strain ATCC BAA-244 / DSM 16087 / CCUG 44356 / LMG 19182 / AMMD) TaxID=339670 RepID=Q0B4U7_BURCM|nr:hypothetical protein Bamb_5279 [Burkholderia ambifaria AMMD]
MVDDYRLACNACGRYCNSAPTLSLRERFRHRHRFVGALTVPTATSATRTNAPCTNAWLDAVTLTA